MLFLLEPGLTSLVHALVESLRFSHPRGFWRPHGRGRLRGRLLFGCLMRLLHHLLLVGDLLSLLHEFLEFLVRRALVWIVVALVTLLLELNWQICLHVLHVSLLDVLCILAHLIVGSVLTCLLKLGPNLIEKVLVERLLIHLTSIYRTGVWCIVMILQVLV